MWAEIPHANSLSVMFFASAFTLWAVAVVFILKAGYRSYGSVYSERIQSTLADIWLFIPLRSLLQLWFLGCVAVVFLSLLSQRSGLTFTLLILIWSIAPWISYHWLKQRRLALFLRQLPDAILLLANSMATGNTMHRGLHFVAQHMPAPLGQEFAVVVRHLKLGFSLADAFQPLTQRMASDDVQRMIMTLLLTAQAGAQQAKMLHTSAQTLRKKQFLQQRIQTISAQGRLQGKVMSAVPLLLLLAFFWLEPEVMRQLIEHPLGWLTGGLIAVLVVSGLFWIQRLLRIPVPL